MQVAVRAAAAAVREMARLPLTVGHEVQHVGLAAKSSGRTGGLQLQSDDAVQAEMPSPDAARPAGAGAAPGAESPVSDDNGEAGEWEL